MADGLRGDIRVASVQGMGGADRSMRQVTEGRSVLTQSTWEGAKGLI